jgi:signal transduction histidine kinase
VRTTAQVTLARDRRLEEEYRESLAIVVEQSGRLSRLVDAMFLLSRAEAKGLPLVVEPLYLDDLASDCVRALRVLADQRGVAIRIEGDTEIALSGDNTLLRQMLGNLVDNAVRHAASTVIVTLARSECDATVRVCDDGPGVAEAVRDRVFERFVRLQTESDGAGLGLPIARWIAEAHGGRLLLEPSKEGACFTITLPASAPLPEAVAASAAPTH